MAHPKSAGQPLGDRASLQPGHLINDPQPAARALETGAIQPVRSHWLAEAEAEALGESTGELAPEDRERMTRAAESLARREQDLNKINSLAVQGFAGPDYEIFAGELAAYAYPVILAWLRRGVIFKYCADKGRPVRVTDANREILDASFDERLGLAMETVAVALKFFRDQVLLKNGWTFRGGAMITTYFVGACLFSFPNVFRRWSGEQDRHRKALSMEMLDCEENGTRAGKPSMDPADLVTRRATIIDKLNAMPERTRKAAALVLDGMSFTEAAARLETTPRGVEGLLYRYRATLDQQRLTGGIRDERTP